MDQGRVDGHRGGAGEIRGKVDRRGEEGRVGDHREGEVCDQGRVDGHRGGEGEVRGKGGRRVGEGDSLHNEDRHREREGACAQEGGNKGGRRVGEGDSLHNEDRHREREGACAQGRGFWNDDSESQGNDVTREGGRSHGGKTGERVLLYGFCVGKAFWHFYFLGLCLK